LIARSITPAPAIINTDDIIDTTASETNILIESISEVRW